MRINTRLLAKKALRLLPRNLRYYVMRKNLKVSYKPIPGIEFKVATTKEELERAYQILHDSYVDEGYMNPDQSGMRINKYFAMPSTTTLVAKFNGVVVGTMSIIRKNGLGLPVEKIFDISKIETNGKIVAEVSALAIDKRFRNKRGTIFLPLCKYFYEYITQYMKIDRAVIAVNPTWRDFYEGFLCFRLIKDLKVDKYDFANGAPAICLWGDFQELKTKFNKIYNSLPDQHNLYKYFVDTRFENFHFPERVQNQTSDPVMTPDLLNYFFRQKTKTFFEMNHNELLQVASAYPQADYLNEFPELSNKRIRETRHAVNFHISSHQLKNLKVYDVSQTGMLVHGLPEEALSVTLQAQVAKGLYSQVLGVVRWRNKKLGLTGLKLVRIDKKWSAFLNQLEGSYERLLNESELRNDQLTKAAQPTHRKAG